MAFADGGKIKGQPIDVLAQRWRIEPRFKLLPTYPLHGRGNGFGTRHRLAHRRLGAKSPELHQGRNGQVKPRSRSGARGPRPRR